MKKYNVYGIGNALVDIVAEVTDSFFTTHQIEKGVMTLVDHMRQQTLLSHLKKEKHQLSGGGSAANTLVALSQFGGNAHYACMVARDELGKFFLDDLHNNQVDYTTPHEQCSEGDTGRCLVMTSPDGQRTLNTFLGISSQLSSANLNEQAIAQSEWIYCEGYLMPSTSGFDALQEAKQVARKHGVKISLTLSDNNMVRFFKSNFDTFIGASIDLIFCNEEEALIFTETSSLEEAKNKLKQYANRFVITLGANGALVFDGDTFLQIEPYRVNLIDSNGAGDMFAGSFLYGITHGHSYASSAKLATLAASKVVSQWGPRLTTAQAQAIKNELFKKG